MYIVQRTERETVYLLIYIRFARNAKFICSGTRSSNNYNIKYTVYKRFVKYVIFSIII